MNKEWDMVRDFHVAFSHPHKEQPNMLPAERVQARYKWMLEEIDEFVASETVVEQADAMIDLIYFALGTLVEMGVRPDGLFKIVHDANMSKLWENGEPRFNSDGKVIKPLSWVDPEHKLIEEISRQCAGKKADE
ncbi:MULTISPECIES: pyrophosphohydrolase domain-containing protein [Aeromonas]|uniref:hypothetical protein n=1 Tax=Aeromonas TaxID=642 RepID=UPI001C23B2E0|nr:MULTISPECIES: hypothetical protein [Aeromonas]QXC00209.1 hypothetical protein I6L48_04635 [Aeromonas sp. FDAARGOS 1418]